MCVIGVDLAAILTPLWVNRKKEQLMKYVEYITLEDKFFFFPDIVIWAHLSFAVGEIASGRESETAGLVAVAL